MSLFPKIFHINILLPLCQIKSHNIDIFHRKSLQICIYNDVKSDFSRIIALILYKNFYSDEKEISGKLWKKIYDNN